MSTTLLERTTDGLTVEVKWLPITQTLVLQCERNGEQAAVTLPPDRALDALDHPTVYLNDAQVAKLYPRPTPE